VLWLKGVWVLSLDQKDTPTVRSPIEGKARAGVALRLELVGPFLTGRPSLFGIVPVGFEKYFLDQTHSSGLTILT
jgi:hypothetical protein